MHDPRLGRFFAVDPLVNEYPYNSSYAFSENSVIGFMEFEGLETITPFRQNFDSELKFQGQTSGESYNLPGLKTNVVKIEQWKQNDNGTYDLYKVIYRDVNSSKEFSVESYAQVSTEKICSFLNPLRPPYKPGGPGDPEWEMRSSGGIQSATILEPFMDVATEGVSNGLQEAGVGKEDADKAAGVLTCLGTIALCKKLGSVSGGKAPTVATKKSTDGISKIIDVGKQGKHIVGHNNYQPGKSILTENPQKLLDSFHSGSANSTQVINTVKTRVDFGKVIGDYVKDGKVTPTTNGIIHNAKNGVHIVPSAPH
jgi:hypothetical protein